MLAAMPAIGSRQVRRSAQQGAVPPIGRQRLSRTACRHRSTTPGAAERARRRRAQETAATPEQAAAATDRRPIGAARKAT
jgi:hypothetical protein